MNTLYTYSAAYITRCSQIHTRSNDQKLHTCACTFSQLHMYIYNVDIAIGTC